MEGNYVGVSFQVISVNLAESELTARMSFRLNGDLAKDPITPAEDLTLFLNGIRGSQEIDFPRGKRINPIEAVFALDGNANYYPFDRYGSKIWTRVTRKARVVRKAPAPSGEPTVDAEHHEEPLGGLLVAAPKESEPVPVKSSSSHLSPALCLKERGCRAPAGNRRIQPGSAAGGPGSRGIRSNHGADAGPGLEHTLDEPPRADVGEKDGTLTFVTLRLPSLRPARASERTTCGTAAWRVLATIFPSSGQRCSSQSPQSWSYGLG